MTHRVIDCLANVHFGETEQQPTFMKKVRDDYFKGPTSMYDPIDLAALLDEMDAHGVRKAILMDSLAKPSVTARTFVEAHPERFALAMGRSQPAAAHPVAARTGRHHQRPTGRLYRCRAQLLGRRSISAQRRGLLPALHQMRRTRAAAVRQHRHARPADPG